MKSIILASASPRRKELLEQVRLPFEVRTCSGEEKITKSTPSDIVMELSLQKALTVFSSLTGEEQEKSLIIGADTIVAFCGHILGKPADEKEAFAMLEMLSGQRHSVYTGVTLAWTGGQAVKTRTFYEQTDVVFWELSKKQIMSYIASGEPMDKAGAYGIQGLAAAFVKEIHGDYYNVVGLPVSRLLREIEAASRQDTV